MVPCYCDAHALPTLPNVCELSKSLPFLPYTLKGAPLPSLEKKLRKKFQKIIDEKLLQDEAIIWNNILWKQVFLAVYLMSFKTGYSFSFNNQKAAQHDLNYDSIFCEKKMFFLIIRHQTPISDQPFMVKIRKANHIKCFLFDQRMKSKNPPLECVENP